MPNQISKFARTRVSRTIHLLVFSVFLLSASTVVSQTQSTDSSSTNGTDDSKPKSGLGGFMSGFKSGMKQGLHLPGERKNEKNVVDTLGLRNILPTYDPTKPISEQYPHVALTVLKLPPNWGSLYQDIGSPKADLFRGCFTLQAVVWTDAQTSKTVGPFDWCSPNDVEVVPGHTYGSLSQPPSSLVMVPNESTGITRTNGPRPPITLVPSDHATMMAKANSCTNCRGAIVDLNNDTSSKFGLMFWNLRAAMGETFTEHDFRVWIVDIKF